MIRWLLAFVFTQLVEVPVYTWALRRTSKPAPSLGSSVPTAFGASALTHPIVWFVIPRAWEQAYLALIALSERFVITSPMARYWCMVVVAETFAVVVEALYVRLFNLPRPFAWSLLANAASLSLGLICRAIFGLP